MNQTHRIEALQTVDPQQLFSGDWQGYWRNLLSSLKTNKVVFIDLDDTAWMDILVALNEAFGPIDPSTQDKRWKLYDAAFKQNGAVIDGVHRTMTNGEHLVAEYEDLFAVKNLDELVAWAKDNIKLMPGFSDFVAWLNSHGIAVVAISNGARQIAEPLLAFHGLTNIPLISNWFVGDKLTFVHGDDVGVDKGLLVRLAHSWGYQVIACAGDSKGDISLAQATSDLGGFVIARGYHGGLSQWCEANVPDLQQVTVTDYAQARLPLEQRLGGQ